MTPLERDTAAARCWLIDAGLELAGVAESQLTLVNQILDKVRCIAACAALPGTMPLRIRCTPNVFKFKA